MARVPAAWMEPMLATLVEPKALPAGWVYEPKLDGVRCIAVRAAKAVQLFSRNRKPLESAYPEIADALLAAVRVPAVLDGEVVAIDPATGVSSFSLLQQRMQLRDSTRARRTGVAVEYWLFDCLMLGGRDLRKLPLTERRAALEEAVTPGGPIRITPSFDGGFEQLYRTACRHGAEGLIGKRAASRYTGGRSRDWVKLKCVNTQEFVIGGWTDPAGSREAFGALLVGYFDEEGLLHYAGKVGTGFDTLTLRSLGAALARRERRTSPFTGGAPPRERGAHWASPSLVAQIGFAEWTHDDRLRHPRFLGLRDDKAPREVRRAG
ncbi:MAG TPA: non-homologous end-joining DNA ligase [Gemmatimonadales bacterium]